jgi:hypothetical protein
MVVIVFQVKCWSSPSTFLPVPVVQVWSQRVDGHVFAALTPCLISAAPSCPTALLVPTHLGGLIALGAATGEQRWRLHVGLGPSSAPSAVGEGRCGALVAVVPSNPGFLTLMRCPPSSATEGGASSGEPEALLTIKMPGGGGGQHLACRPLGAAIAPASKLLAGWWSGFLLPERALPRIPSFRALLHHAGEIFSPPVLSEEGGLFFGCRDNHLYKLDLCFLSAF